MTPAAYLGQGGLSQPGNAQRGGVPLNELTSGRIMTISAALGGVGKTPLWKKMCQNETLSSRRPGAEMEALRRGARTQEMISGVNEAFRECPAASWYGEVNKTCRLKRKLGLERERGGVFTRVL